MKKKLILLVLLIASITVFAVACTVDVKYADPKVVSITVDNITKTTYTACDALDISGANVIVKYDNGENLTVPLTDEMLDHTSFNMDEPGDQTVRVFYGGQETSFSITVLAWNLLSVELNSLPYVLDYVVGEYVDPQGATIKCSFEGDKTKYFDVTSDMLLPYDNDKVGTTTVNLRYYGVTMGFNVNFSEKTVISVKIVDSAANNFVYVGLGERYDVAGMTLRLTYDNDETPLYSADELGDVFVSMDDSSARSLDAVLMYYPSDYCSEYTYRFLGVSRVSVGDIVTPGEEIASNKVIRDGKEIVLDAITSKSYGTVTSIWTNSDGSSGMTINTAIRYALTNVQVSEGDIVAVDGYLGNRGLVRVYTKGGGIVESVGKNGVVTIKTAPTTVFVSNVIEKSYESMEIISNPRPAKFKETTINDMIEGDTLDKSFGAVRVHYDDGSEQVFGMDDSMIGLYSVLKDEDGVDYVSDKLTLTPGRNHIHVIYGGVEKNFEDMYVTVNAKYPVALTLGVDTISDRVFYFGDTISLSSMTYFIEYNNGSISQSMQITNDMVMQIDDDPDSGLLCRERANVLSYSKEIRFQLPPASYSDVTGYTYPICRCTVAPQPILRAEMVVKPTKVYVRSREEIDLTGAVLDIYYRNNDRLTKTIDFVSSMDEKDELILKSEVEWVYVDSWDKAINHFKVNGRPDFAERLYCFMLNKDTAGMDIAQIVRKEVTPYEARLIYVDSRGVMSSPISVTVVQGEHEGETEEVWSLDCNTMSSFGYYLLPSGGLTVKEIKVSSLKDSGGKTYYKTNYTQYEDMSFEGLIMTVTYSNNTSMIMDILPEMVYSGGTNLLGSAIPIKFTYLGANDDTSLQINVSERKPIAITLEKKGKDVYIAKSSMRMDFEDYRFVLKYNSGPDEVISGLTLINSISYKEVSSGWWYRMYDSTGAVIDSYSTPQTGSAMFRLFYSYADSNSPGGYSYIGTPTFEEVANSEDMVFAYSLELVENNFSVVEIKYEQNVVVGYGADNSVINPTANEYLNGETTVSARFPKDSSNNYPVLAEVAAGWEMMLSEYYNGKVIDKVLTVKYVDSEGEFSYDYVKILPSMLDYDITDKTQGYRKVTIMYANCTCLTYVYVWNASLSGVDVETIPLQNYIYTAIKSEADLVLTGGIVRLTFTKLSRYGDYVGEMSKYINMDNKDLSYSGFIPGLYSKSGKQITIIVTYKDYTEDDMKASYTITVFDKQDLNFTYSNVIFFYGNASPAKYTAKQTIPEFYLPSEEGKISLKYMEMSNTITMTQYLALSSSQRKSYIPVTVRDANDVNAPVLFIKASKVTDTYYIDPAAGKFYVKYGNICMLDEEFYALLTDHDKEYFSPLPTYGFRGQTVETYYIIDENDLVNLTGIEGTILTEKINRYVDVIVDKITVSEYEALTDKQRAEYEETDNKYYILMCVVDDREEKERFYETASYAIQPYTIIPKNVTLTIEATDETAKVLRVRTKMNGGAEDANPYSIFYLQSTSLTLGIINKKLDELKADATYGADANYIFKAYLASPNKDYFEIVITFMKTYSELEATEKARVDRAAAELYYNILCSLMGGFSLTGEDYYEIDRVNFDFVGKSDVYNFNPNQHDQMINKIMEKWYTGINVFSGDDYDRIMNEIEGNADHKSYNYISYTFTFGDMKTRHGILQLLDGQLCFTVQTDNQGNVNYTVAAGNLSHSSYSIAATKIVTVDEANKTLTVK